MFFLALSALAPLTAIAGTVPLAIVLGNGAAAPAGFLAAGAVVLVFCVGFVAMSRRVADVGAMYRYVDRGLGRTAGASGAGLALLAYLAIQAAAYGLYGEITSNLLRDHASVTVPWWVCALVTLAIVGGLSCAGVKLGARVLTVLSLAEFMILLVFGLSVLIKGGGPEGLAPAQSFSLKSSFTGAPGVALMFGIASMLGFEATAAFGPEAKHPHRTIPRATYLVVLATTGFYTLVSWMLISSYGPNRSMGAAAQALEDGRTVSFTFDPVSDELGSWAGHVLPYLLASSLFACLLAFHNTTNRYLFSLGRDRLLPERLSALNHRRSPWAASWVQSIILLMVIIPFVVADMSPVVTLFSWFAGVAVLAIMVLYLMTSLSVIAYFRKTPHPPRWSTLVAPALASACIVAAAWLVLSNFTVLIGGATSTAVWLACSVPAVIALFVVLARLRPARHPISSPRPQLPEP